MYPRRFLIAITILLAIGTSACIGPALKVREIAIKQELTPTITSTPALIPTLTSSSTPTSLPIMVVVGEDSIINIYKDLVEANKQTVTVAQKTFDWILGIASFLTVFITGAGGFSIYKVQKLYRRAEKAQKQIDKLEKSLTEDLNMLNQLHSLYTVDQYAMHAFSDSSGERIGSRKELVQLSKNDDPIVRRECLRAFGAMPRLLQDWWDAEVFLRIKEMMERDPEGGVKREASLTYELWNSKRTQLVSSDPPPSSTE